MTKMTKKLGKEVVLQARGKRTNKNRCKQQCNEKYKNNSHMGNATMP